MKTLLKTLLLGLVITLLFNCNSDDTDNQQPEGYYLETKLDNTDYTAKPETVLVDYYEDNGQFMTITATDYDFRQITMIVNLQNYTEGSGTYDQNTVVFVFSIQDSEGLTTCQWSSLSGMGDVGTLTIIEEDNTHVKGTFTFSAGMLFADGCLNTYNSTVFFTEGKFNAKKS